MIQRAWLVRLFSLRTWWAAATPEEIALRRTVRQLVEIADGLDGSGEYKRHLVYARLLKLYPEQSKRHLAWLIEDVLREQRAPSS